MEEAWTAARRRAKCRLKWAGGDPNPAAGFWLSQSSVTHRLSPPGSYLVMPYMFTDLSKVRSQLSEEKVQFLVYQMLCGLRVSGGTTAAADLAGSGIIAMIVAN